MPCVVFVCREGWYEVAGVFESYLTELTWPTGRLFASLVGHPA